jgi:hypothetical protein
MCPEVSGVAEVAEGRWWLECGPGRAGVAGNESQELSGVSPESRRESPGVGSCLEQGKGHPGGWCKGP